MIYRRSDIAGARILVMGLGLHGGGMGAARFFAEHGAEVTVTDLRDEAVLAPSVEGLSDLPIRYVLGRHEEKDFEAADIVIKNPSVPRSSPLLALARRVETDLSIFLRLSANPLIAVTGSKGKSTTVTAIHSVLLTVHPGARLGGNITVSPLGFLDSLAPEDPVVLELSSWQLADLAPSGLLKPRVAAITTILPDHQNMYRGMDDYVADKKVIYARQDERDFTICAHDESWGRQFAAETRGRVLFTDAGILPDALDGGYLTEDGGVIRMGGRTEQVFGRDLCVQGDHHRRNLLTAALALSCFGVPPEVVREGLGRFPGIEHRLEMVAVKAGVSFYNDSAATIPHATVAALRSFTSPVILIAGGTDKNIDFGVLAGAARIPKAVVLLAGSATGKIVSVLEAEGVSFAGPFHSLAEALETARAKAAPGDSVVLSPGCASFGMFLNEFDRGRRFRELVRSLPG